MDAHDSAHHAEARGAEGEGVMEGEGVGLIGGKLEWERYREGEDAGVEVRGEVAHGHMTHRMRGVRFKSGQVRLALTEI